MVSLILLLNKSKFGQHSVVRLNSYRRLSSCANGATNIDSTFTDSKYQPIADFYSGKSVFVTGGTGYCGKVLVEKLLYSCTGLDKIYLLIRDKKDEDINTRLEKLFANPLFARVKKSTPQSLDKVIPIRGDITLPGMGMKSEDEQNLINKVSVVFHVAATVMFNVPLGPPMKINFEGTQKLLDLCKRMKKIEGFLCMSTAYAHTQRPILSEKIYPAPAILEDVYRFMEEHGNNMEQTQKFIRGRSNTYSFVKALMESYVAENHGHVPTCIIRPSIVTPTLNEPVKGWVDNWYGATGVFHNIAKGWDHISLGDRNRIGDYTPVDHVANLSIVAAARVKGSEGVQVYNSTTSAENPLSWADAYEYIIKGSLANGYNEAPFPFVIHSKSKLFVNVLTVLQTIPAHMMDIWLRLTGKEPKYAKVVTQAIRLRKSYEYFNTQSWTMEADRTAELFSKMSPEDQKQFPCHPADINWPEYMKEYCKGIERYLKPKYTVRT